MERSEIEHQLNGNKGSFLVKDNGTILAELTYSLTGTGVMIIDHTGVSDVLRGTGTGLALVESAVAHAREEDLRIMPLCPFAKAQFDKHPEWKDLKM